MNEQKPKYTWPWAVLAGLVLAVLLAVLWMSREIQRTKRNRDFSAPNAQIGTNGNLVQPR